MGAQGTVNVDFGAFPGKPTAEIAVTGQTLIGASSLIEAWIHPPGGTADHSEDEHIVENLKLVCGAIVNGTGFTIYAEAVEPDTTYQPAGVRLTGLWQIAWVWN